MHEATYTPEWLARDMVGLADIRPAQYILEPSAGKGALVEAILDRLDSDDAYITAYELNLYNFRELEEFRQFASMKEVSRKDFLKVDHPIYMQRYFDRVVMNPPVKSSMQHVEHAMKFLAPKGRLVALLHSHVARDVKNQHGAREYRISGGTFHIDNQELDASLIVWDKPLP